MARHQSEPAFELDRSSMRLYYVFSLVLAILGLVIAAPQIRSRFQYLATNQLSLTLSNSTSPRNYWQQRDLAALGTFRYDDQHVFFDYNFKLTTVPTDRQPHRIFQFESAVLKTDDYLVPAEQVAAFSAELLPQQSLPADFSATESRQLILTTESDFSRWLVAYPFDRAIESIGFFDFGQAEVETWQDWWWVSVGQEK